MSTNVEISTARYEYAHHRKPRGYGLWYFRMPDGLTFSFAGTYARARRAAAERLGNDASGFPARIQLYP